MDAIDLPAVVLGPVLRRAFRLFAAIRFGEVMAAVPSRRRDRESIVVVPVERIVRDRGVARSR
jgi:hypothetical protein